MSEGDFSDEAEAVRSTNGLMDADDVAVLGFGSAGGTRPPVVTACDFGDDFPSCLDDLRRRNPAEGDDTDFTEAILHGIRQFDAADGVSSSVLVMLTDGEYDPDGDGSVSPNEAAALDQALDQARDAKVQVWPIGFGASNLTELQRLADRGAALICAGRDPAQPEPIHLSNPAQLGERLKTVVIDAQCGQESQGSFDVGDEIGRVRIPYPVESFPEGGPYEINVTGPKGTLVVPCELSGSTVMCLVDVDRLGAGEWTVDPAPGFERVIYERAPRQLRELRLIAAQDESDIVITLQSDDGEALRPRDGRMRVAWEAEDGERSEYRQIGPDAEVRFPGGCRPTRGWRSSDADL